MHNFEAILNGSSAFAAFVAAGLWFWSTRVKVKFGNEQSVEGWTRGGAIDLDGNDQLATLTLSNRWSMRASLMAGISALLQSVAIFVR